MSKRCLIIGLSTFIAQFCLNAVLLADEPLASASAHALAPIAPEGRWVTRLEVRQNGYDHRYNNDGKREELGAVFDGVALDSGVFPALALLGNGASLGTTSLQSEVSLERVEWTLGYGLTKNLTVGGIINYGRIDTQVNFAVHDGNVGWHPAFDSSAPIDAGNFPFAPVGGGASAAMTASDINRILTNPAFGYNYDAIGDAQTSGAGDLLLGMLWRFYDVKPQSMVLGLGVRQGLARADNPDNLFDVPLNDGGSDLVAQWDYYYQWGSYDFRGEAKRTVQLADKATLRVPAPGEVLALASSKERLSRDLGDFWEYDLELGYRWQDWRFSTTWHRWQKEADGYRSSSQQDTSALEDNTAIRADQWRLAVSWSGIHAWQAGRMPLPLIVKLEMQETYAGRNMVDVRDVYLIATTFF